MAKELRPYQLECHEAVIENYNKGITRPLITLFTGAGKTFLLIKLLERMGFKRILWLSFQTELISQSGLAFIRDKWPELYDKVYEQGFVEYSRSADSKIGVIKGDVFKTNLPITMGSVMTVVNRLNRIPSDYFDCVVTDEAHLYMSNSSQKVLAHLNPKMLIGCTATATRGDGLPLSDIFQKIVFDYDLSKGIKDGYACELDAIRIKTNVSLDKVKTTAGEFNLKDLSDEIDTVSRNQLVVESYKKYCEGRQCIAFCVDIAHAIHLAEQFQTNGYDCIAVSSNDELTPNRSQNIKDFKSGKLQIITNVNILVAGFDHIDTGCVIMACPTKSLTKYLQAVGRCARLKSEPVVERFGQNAIIIDVVDVTSRHNLINAWELDKQKPIEERTFISQEKRDKLLAARNSAKITHQRKEDEVVKLLQIPRLKIPKFFTMSDDATEAQLQAISRWGYDTTNVHYTKFMITEIFAQQECSPKQCAWLKWKGYDLSGGIPNRGEFEAARKEVEKKEVNRNLSNKQ